MTQTASGATQINAGHRRVFFRLSYVALLMMYQTFSGNDAMAQEAAAGHTLAQAHCARCHAIEPEGSSSHVEAPPFREVATRYPPADLAEALSGGGSTAHQDMPEFIFSAKQVRHLIAYLETLQ